MMRTLGFNRSLRIEVRGERIGAGAVTKCRAQTRMARRIPPGSAKDPAHDDGASAHRLLAAQCRRDQTRGVAGVPALRLGVSPGDGASWGGRYVAAHAVRGWWRR